MKKLCAWVAVAVIAALCGALAEDAAGIWQFTYYVDEFRMPTDEGYIRNAEPIEGIFSNSATTDSKLDVVILLDEHQLAFMLYEYGRSLVKNSYSRDRIYNVTLRDAAGRKTALTGTMPSNADRILFEEKDAEKIVNALSTDPTVAFYIEQADNPTTNYLFTVQDTSGFSEMAATLVERANERDYNAAVASWNAGYYKRALATFARLKDYKDSAEWDGKYRALMYEQAEAALAAKSYVEANLDFIEAGGYLDARQRVGEPYYVQAEELLAAGEYEAANQAFIDAGDYGDAAERVGEPYYVQAEALLEAGDYETASIAFRNAGNYSDAKERVGEPYYLQAEALLEAGEYAAANAAFTKAGSYKDAAQRVGEPYYIQAEVLLTAGEYEAAREAFIKAGDYGDAAERVDEPYYAQAEALLAQGDAEGAIAAFKQAGDFRDASDRWPAISYELAERLMAAGDYDAANEAFIDAGSYSDAQARVGEPFYREGEQRLSESRYDEAVRAFKRAGAYSDAKERVKAVYYEKAKALQAAGDHEAAYQTYQLIAGYGDVDAILSDDEDMRRVSREHYVAQFDVGNVVTFGTYEQDNVTANGSEPIEWRVVATNGANGRLLVAVYGLETLPFNTTKANVAWDGCSLRAWLNNAFVHNAFTAEEQAKITLTQLNNPVYTYTTGEVKGYDPETTDKVFILSYEEATRYFADNASRVTPPTPYALAHGAYTSKKGNCWRWLRNRGSIGNCAAYIDFDGSLKLKGDHVSQKDACVQPAMWINIAG